MGKSRDLFKKIRDIKGIFHAKMTSIKGRNGMEMTRDIFKNIRDTKRTFHAIMGTIKDRNGTELMKQKILRRGAKNTQKKYTQKIFMT